MVVEHDLFGTLINRSFELERPNLNIYYHPSLILVSVTFLI